MTQTFECPQCHETVKPDPLACYSCGMTAEVRPTVVTGEHRKMVAEAQEAIEDAFAHLINHQLNHRHNEYTDGIEAELRTAITCLEKLYREFSQEQEAI